LSPAVVRLMSSQVDRWAASRRIRANPLVGQSTSLTHSVCRQMQQRVVNIGKKCRGAVIPVVDSASWRDCLPTQLSMAVFPSLSSHLVAANAPIPSHGPYSPHSPHARARCCNSATDALVCSSVAAGCRTREGQFGIHGATSNVRILTTSQLCCYCLVAPLRPAPALPPQLRELRGGADHLPHLIVRPTRTSSVINTAHNPYRRHPITTRTYGSTTFRSDREIIRDALTKSKNAKAKSFHVAGRGGCGDRIISRIIT